MVDQLGDGPLITGDVAGGEDDRVTLFQLDLLVIVHGDPHQGRHRLPLAAGGDDADLFRRQMIQFADIHQLIIGNLQIAQITGDSHVVDHGAAIQQHLAASGGSHIGHLLHPVDIA